MAEDQDLERRLDSMFASLRPSPLFEDELWRRLSRQRPWWARFAGPRPILTRLAPALAAVIVVAGGAAYLVAQRPAETASTGSSAAPAYSSSPAAFGRLPRPGFPGQGKTDQAAAPLMPMQQNSAAYRFTGAAPDLPPAASVYRYAEPDAAQRTALARELSSRSGLTVSISASRGDAGLPPSFAAVGKVSGSAPGQSPGTSAADLLRQLQLMPGYATREIAGDASVTFARELQIGSASVPLVDVRGKPIGIEVSFAGAQARITGPIDTPLVRATYPLRSGADAVAAMDAGLPASAGPAAGAGRGVLDRAELVYVVVSAGTHGYLEPAVLFSGPGGVVLVPAIAADHLLP